MNLHSLRYDALNERGRMALPICWQDHTWKMVLYFYFVSGWKEMISLIIFFMWFLWHLQVKLSEKSSLLDTAESKIAELTEKVAEQQKLIQKLEEDILKVWIFSQQKFLLWFILYFLIHSGFQNDSCGSIQWAVVFFSKQ